MRSNQKNIIIKIITTPYRAICKAKDFYVRSITDCANHTNYGGVAAASFGAPISRTSSTSSFGSSTASAEDLRELIRANSTARMGSLDITRADVELYVKQYMMTKPVKGSRRVPRSASVGMGRIDEDAPVSFAEDEDIGRKVKTSRSDHLMFPRSRSHAVTSSNKFNRFS